MKQRVAFLKSSLSSSVMSIPLFSCILSFVPSLISLNMFIAEKPWQHQLPYAKKYNDIDTFEKINGFVSLNVFENDDETGGCCNK